jgi:redox-sensitive bicupin YhaK (pirin superfamily)
MIQHIPASSRYAVDHGWLKSNFSFSFAEYYDPENMGFGPLRVLNDDQVAPNKGFGMHPHRNMEIITFVLSGELEHRDNLGNREIMKPGVVQKMTAGRGILHSEINPSPTDVVELLQLWIEPSQLHLEPGYEMVQYKPDELINQLHPVIAPHHAPGQGHINQDATLYLSQLQTSERLIHSFAEARKGFLFLIDGQLTVNDDIHLSRRDSLRISNESQVAFVANQASTLLFIDLPHS